jgi:uncharacterized membrane protein YphA (DoxX/SURF4 family)
MVEPGCVVNRAAYWPAIGGIYFLVGVLFFYSGKGKLFDDDGHAPAALAKQFDGTFIATFPGVDAVWVILGILELLAGLGVALFTFACLSFGQTTTGNNEGTASLYTYFGSTAIIMLLVLRLSPSAGRAQSP